MFCCVDSIDARSAIWRSAGRRTAFWADGRMLAETIRVLVAADEFEPAALSDDAFRASEAQPGSCTARSTIYTANIAAGLMVHQFVRWLRRQPVDADLSFNLLASEVIVNTRHSNSAITFTISRGFHGEACHGDVRPCAERSPFFVLLFQFSGANMSQRELDEAVAQATGESVALIHGRGFGVADPFDVHYDPEPRRPLVYDWDSRSPIEWPA